MNFNIYIEEIVANKINQMAKSIGKSRNAIIREALQDWLTRNTMTHWPEEILKFEGFEEFPEFEAQRTKNITKEKG